MFALNSFGRLGAMVKSGWSPTTLFSAGEAGGLYDFTQLANLYQDSAGTTPVTAVGDPIGKVLDTSGNGNHASQSTSTKRPVLGRMPATGVRNLLVNTATLSTQNVTTVAGSYTIQFTGAGSVTASGTYSGALTNGQTFTCTAGTLTLTVSGSVTAAQLEAGATATAKQVVGAAYDVTESGVASVYNAYFDGVDDYLTVPGTSGVDVGTVAAGFRLSAAISYAAVVSTVATSSYVAQGIQLGSGGTGFYINQIAGETLYNSSGTRVNGASETALPVLQPSVVVTVGTGFPVSRVWGSNIQIGQDRAIGGRNIKGFLSLAMSNSRVLAADEITAMERYMAPKTPGAIVIPPSVDLFEDNGTTRLYDDANTNVLTED